MTMKRILMISMMMTLLTVSISSAAEKDGPVKWLSYEAALNESVKTGKPLLIHFTADWCSWCKRMKRDTYSHPDVARMMNEDFVPTMVDTDANPQLKAEYGVEGLPTIWFMKGPGEGITYVPGYVDAPTFKNLLQWIATESYTEQSFDDFTKTPIDKG